MERAQFLQAVRTDLEAASSYTERAALDRAARCSGYSVDPLQNQTARAAYLTNNPGSTSGLAWNRLTSSVAKSSSSWVIFSLLGSVKPSLSW